MFETREKLLESERIALKTVQSDCALTKTLRSDYGCHKNWNFFLNQLHNPKNIRPVKRLGYGTNRNKTWDPRDGKWYKRSNLGKRGRYKDTPFIKKTSFSLAPSTGQFVHFTTRASIGVVAHIDDCKTKEKYIWRFNVSSNSKWWLSGATGTQYRATTIQKLRESNQAAVRSNRINEHNELLVCPQKKALRAVFVPIDDLITRLNAIYRQQLVFNKLSTDLPILIMDSRNPVSVYSCDEQICDIITGKHSNGFAKSFADLVCPNLDTYIHERLHLIDTNKIGRIIYYLLLNKHINLAKKLLLSNPTTNLDYHNAKTGKTPLHYAIEAKDEGLINALIKSGAECARVDKEGRSSLRKACLEKNFSAALLMLTHGQVNHAKSSDLGSVILILMRNDKQAIIYKLLAKFENISMSWFDTPDKIHLLHYGIKHNVDLDLFTQLVKRGASVTALNKSRKTPLKMAITEGKIDYAKIMIEHGDVTSYDKSYIGDVLFDLIAAKHFTLAITLLQRYSQQNTISEWFNHSQKKSLLQMAVASSKWKLARLLIQKGCDISFRGRSGKTQLEILAERQQFDLVDFCLTEANLSKISDQALGKIFITLVKNKKFDLAEMLFDIRPKIPIQKTVDRNSNRIAHVIAVAKQTSLLIKVFKHSKHVQCTNDFNETPMSIYCLNQNNKGKFREGILSCVGSNVKRSRYLVLEYLQSTLNNCETLDKLYGYYIQFKALSCEDTPLKGILKRQRNFGLSLFGHEVSGVKTSCYHTMLIKLFKVTALQIIMEKISCSPHMLFLCSKLLNEQRSYYKRTESISLKIFKLESDAKKHEALSQEEISLERWGARVAAAAA